MPNKDPEKRKEQALRSYHKHRDEILKRRRKYYKEHTKEIQQKHRDKDNRLYQRILAHYGAKCKLCGATNVKFGIDHIGGINNGSPKCGVKLWYYLIRNNFPPEFRLLCTRCNLVDGIIRSYPLLGLKGIDELLELKRRCDGERK